MVVDLRECLEIQGSRLAIDWDFAPPSTSLYGIRPFETPVHVAGAVENRAGIVELCYTADFTLRARCDRCQADLAKGCREDFRHTLLRESNTDDYGDDVVLIPDAKLDLAELVRTDILLSVPSRILCKEDCKGLCPQCGQNRNEGACGCEAPGTDPRLLTLMKLMNQDDDS